MALEPFKTESFGLQFDSTREVLWACLTTLQRHGNDNPRLLIDAPYQAAIASVASAYAREIGGQK